MTHGESEILLRLYKEHRHKEHALAKEIIESVYNGKQTTEEDIDKIYAKYPLEIAVYVGELFLELWEKEIVNAE